MKIQNGIWKIGLDLIIFNEFKGFYEPLDTGFLIIIYNTCKKITVVLVILLSSSLKRESMI